MADTTTPSLESAVRAALTRIDQCLSSEHADRQYALEEIEQILSTALPEDGQRLTEGERS